MIQTIVPTAGISPSAEDSSPPEKPEKPIKLPTCVTQKKNGRFIARIIHPKLETRVSLGTFATPEAAEVAVEKMEEQFGYTERKPPRSLPSCVERRKGRFRARIRHPGLKTRVSLGSFATPDEAEAAVLKFREQFGCPERSLVRNLPSRIPRRLPICVEERRGRFRARIRHPVLKTRVSLGWFGTPQEAVVAVLKFREQFGCDTKLRGIYSEFDEEKCTADRFGGVEELHGGVRPCSGSGIVNEYGQLLDEYSNLDDALWFDTQQK